MDACKIGANFLIGVSVVDLRLTWFANYANLNVIDVYFPSYSTAHLLKVFLEKDPQEDGCAGDGWGI